MKNPWSIMNIINLDAMPSFLNLGIDNGLPWDTNQKITN